jgi:8-oxo-dGTP pyrophosphatase MutT (NUDIX family)
MQAWKTLNKRTVLENGKWVTVEYRTLELPDGQIIDDWTWIQLPEYINVVAVTEVGRFLCFEQVKYAVEGVTLAPVGGYLEAGEAPLVAAQRELLEETGYSAPEWINLGNYVVDGNRGAGIAHLFLAKGAVQTAKRNADDLEEQKLVLLDRPEVEAALRAGAFKVLAWSANVAMALLYL